MLQQWDREALKVAFSNAKLIPFVMIDNFPLPEAATEIAAAYPPFEKALEQGNAFSSVKERRRSRMNIANVLLV